MLVGVTAGLDAELAEGFTAGLDAGFAEVGVGDTGSVFTVPMDPGLEPLPEQPVARNTPAKTRCVKRQRGDLVMVTVSHNRAAEVLPMEARRSGKGKNRQHTRSAARRAAPLSAMT